jgi:tetratricopeptide (TPR) repeat protein
MVQALLAVAFSALSLPALALAPETGDAPRQLKPLLERADALYTTRDEAGHLGELEKLLKEAEQAAPQDYEVLWRLARLYFWLSDDPSISDDQKSRIGKRGWELGERAVKADPKRVEGQYYAAVTMGNYALGLGVLKALRQGIEGKFKERLSRAEKADPDYSDGAIPTAWGRFYFKLPWPKYDADKSERYLLQALKKSPQNIRARLYLADLYVKEDHSREARAQLEKVVAHQPGSYDAPEERRTLQMARAQLARMK